MNEPEDKYYSSETIHLTLRQFSKYISYYTQTYISVNILLAYMDSYWRRTIPMQWMWQSFFANFHLKEHFKIHTGDKPYQCGQYAKAFSTKCDVKWHLKRHSEEKPYTGRHCVKAFSKKSDLTKHLETHSEDKPKHR